MSIPHRVARVLSACTAACALFAVAAPAPAAVVAIFDPAFGPSIPNLGFRGSILLDVAPGCYQQGGGFVFTGGACTITPEQATVNFYNVNHNPNNTLTTVPLASGAFASNYVYGAYFDPVSGQLAGIDTNDSSQFFFSVSDQDPTNPVAYVGSMVLYFVSGQAPASQTVPAGAAAPAATQPGVGGAFLRNCQRGSDNCAGTPSNAANLTFTTVPEPDSIALALLGFGALVVARRRKPTVR